jgi:hypothetical protein
MKKIASLLLCLLAWPAVAQEPSPDGHANGPMRVQAVRPDGSVVSPNWSGYAVTGADGSVTSVAGSWVVPQATCGGADPKNSGASHWVGIDGYTSTTVEQTGTDSDCSNGTPKYYAWYEFYPNPGITIRALSVQAGDVMRASVTYSGTQFVVSISDERTQQTFTASAAVPQAKRNSAEWIAEANSTHFSNFGTVFFGQDQTGAAGTCEAAVNGASPLPIAGFRPLLVHAITMADSAGTEMAAPGPLSADGTSFLVQWQSLR